MSSEIAGLYNLYMHESHVVHVRKGRSRLMSADVGYNMFQNTAKFC